ncbi:MAG: hypothetical protein AAF514_14300, partial [Verrucomicrobiota bacterium]
NQDDLAPIDDAFLSLAVFLQLSQNLMIVDFVLASSLVGRASLFMLEVRGSLTNHYEEKGQGSRDETSRR